jgi:hypothetical protein
MSGPLGKKVLRCIGRYWHFASFAAPQHFVRYWTRADNGGFLPAMVCRLLTRSGQRWILANEGLSVTICALAVVSYPAFLGRLASLYTLTLAIISPLPQGRGISLILLFWQRAPDFRSSRMAVRRTFSLKAVSNIRGANFFEPAPRTIHIFHLALMMRITLASLLGA